MKKIVVNRLILTLITVFCIFSLIIPTSYADAIAEKEASKDISSIFTAADDFLEKGDNKTTTISDNIKDMSDTVYNVLLIIGTIIAVIIGLVIAIQFIVGSVEQRAKVKETLIAYVVGCVVIFGAFGIWALIVNILQGLPTN